MDLAEIARRVAEWERADRLQRGMTVAQYRAHRRERARLVIDRLAEKRSRPGLTAPRD